MEIPNCFLYAAPIGEFVNTVEKSRIDDIIDTMIDNAQKARVNCTDSEIRSWKNTFFVMAPLLASDDISNDTIIAFEYQIPFGGRIDCVLFGEDKEGNSNMVHIELKQWSNNNVSEYYSGYTFCTDIILDGGQQIKYVSHPSAQANEYQNHLLNYIHAFDDKKIKLHGFAFCYNYIKDDENAILCNDSYRYITSRCPLFCRDQVSAFADKLKELVGYGKGRDIMNAIVTSKIAPTKRLQDVAKNIFDYNNSTDEFSLVGAQLDAYNAILGSILKEDKNDEKTVIVVKGGPGTGKSVIAMRLLAGLAKSGRFNNVYYSTRSTSLINGYTEILKNISYASGGENNATDLIIKASRIKPNNGESWIDALIVDEAHRIERFSNDQNEQNKEDQTHLSQIMNFLFSSRVSVFFIDDFQSVRNQEIGCSKNIKDAASNYYNRIKAENESYLNGGPNAYHNGIPKLKETVKRYTEKLEEIKFGDKRRIHDLTKKLNSAKKELEVAESWVAKASPNVKAVNYLEFELTDQFRCNGSNNYLDWIEHVIYGTKCKNNVKLDTKKYTFEVFNTPTELYQKIRSLDDYAVFSDNLEKKGIKYSDILEQAKGKEFHQKARLLAGWCWPWEQSHLEENGDLLHEIIIDEGNGHTFSIPWETKGVKPRCEEFKYRYAKNADLWLNDNKGVNQAGCIHSAQGWEVDYVGVIIAGDIAYDKQNDCLCINEAIENQDKKVPKSGIDRDRITRNIYRVLLTRGKKGCFIYAVDPEVREYFKRCLNNQ